MRYFKALHLLVQKSSYLILLNTYVQKEFFFFFQIVTYLKVTC
jgi:hypothetical protein